MLQTYQAGTGFQGTDEYAPPGADNTQIATGLPAACLVSAPSIALGVSSTNDAPPAWSAGQGTCEATFVTSHSHPEHLRINATTSHSGFLILRLRSYPAWRVQVNDRKLANLPTREDGLMVVPVPQGTFKLTVDWITTSDVIFGRWLSILTVLLLAAFYFLERRVNLSHLS
jgi:hypothetical protein